MCGPLAIAAAVLTAGSMGANMIAQSKISHARDNVINAERARQRGFDQQTDALNTNSQDKFLDFQGQQGGNDQQLSDYFTGQTAATSPGVIPASDSNITVQEDANQAAKAKAFSDRQAGALGKLRSFGDTLGDINRGVARNDSQVGILNGFKQNSERVSESELDAANNKGGGLKMLGDLLGGVGQLAGGLSLRGPEALPSWLGGASGVTNAAGPALQPGSGFASRIRFPSYGAVG